MLLTESRRPARATPDGDVVLLADQDRSLWDAALIAEGQALVRACLRRNQPGPVPAPGGDQRGAQRRRRPPPTPTGGRSSRSTTSCWRSCRPRWWRSIARWRWPRWTARRPALALVDGLDLPRHQLFHAVRADLLRRLGRDAEAAAAYDAAIALTGNEPDRALLQRRRASLGP